MLYGRNHHNIAKQLFSNKKEIKKKKKTHNVSQSTNKKDSDEALRDNDEMLLREGIIQPRS